jgi:hypothetical protein
MRSFSKAQNNQNLWRQQERRKRNGRKIKKWDGKEMTKM